MHLIQISRSFHDVDDVTAHIEKKLSSIHGFKVSVNERDPNDHDGKRPNHPFCFKQN